MMDLNSRVAIVTGGSRGIGKEVAKKLASLGSNLVINYTSKEDEALKTKEEIEALGVKCITLKCDVSKSEEVNDMVNKTLEEFGKVDILNVMYLKVVMLKI